MGLPFSKRNKPAPATLRYDIPDMVRGRILSAFALCTEGQYAGMHTMIQDAGKMCALAYGGYRLPSHGILTSDAHKQITDHFMACRDEEVIDFIEWCFQSQGYGVGQVGVDIINGIFRQEGIGYEFSPYTERRVEMPKGTYRLDRKYPEATVKTNELAHQEIVMPTLKLLGDPAFQSANDHMLKAHELYRKGDNRSAITECGSALETVLKTICQKKQWAYTPDKDVLSGLVQVCNDNGLFYPFYVEILKNCGTIRNKLGAHGQEPVPTYTTESEHVEHMIHLVSSHILFLAKVAGMA